MVKPNNELPGSAEISVGRRLRELRRAEPFIVTLEPNADSGPTPIVHTGREFVYCIEGRLAYTIEERTFILEPGDSLLFEAFLPHRVHQSSFHSEHQAVVNPATIA